MFHLISYNTWRDSGLDAETLQDTFVHIMSFQWWGWQASVEVCALNFELSGLGLNLNSRCKLLLVFRMQSEASLCAASIGRTLNLRTHLPALVVGGC